MLAFLLPVALAVPIELPAGEEPADWEAALELAGLSLGSSTDCPSVRVTAETTGWRVEVCDRSGARHAAVLPPPTNPRAREDLAWLATAMLRPVARKEHSTPRLPPAPVVALNAPPATPPATPPVESRPAPPVPRPPAVPAGGAANPAPAAAASSVVSAPVVTAPVAAAPVSPPAPTIPPALASPVADPVAVTDPPAGIDPAVVADTSVAGPVALPPVGASRTPAMVPDSTPPAGVDLAGRPAPDAASASAPAPEGAGPRPRLLSAGPDGSSLVITVEPDATPADTWGTWVSAGGGLLMRPGVDSTGSFAFEFGFRLLAGVQLGAGAAVHFGSPVEGGVAHVQGDDLYVLGRAPLGDFRLGAAFGGTWWSWSAPDGAATGAWDGMLALDVARPIKLQQSLFAVPSLRVGLEPRERLWVPAPVALEELSGVRVAVYISVYHQEVLALE